MNRLIFIFAVVLLAIGIGCNPDTYWRLEYKPVTQAERDALRQHVEAAICTTKRDLTVSGHDQDLDDYAATVYRHAAMVVCEPRMFEYKDPGGWGNPYIETGRWRPLAMEEYKAEPKVEVYTGGVLKGRPND